MAQRHEFPPFRYNLIIVPALAIGTIAGWGMYFISGHSAAEAERQLREQVSSLHHTQMELLSEKERTKTTLGDLQALRTELEKLRQEADLVMQARDLAQAELVTAATGMKELMGQLKQDGGDVSATGSASVDSEHIVTVTAQNALNKLGYGHLKADGVVGPSTRRAIEAFQRANNLHVTSELDASTLRLLTPEKHAAR